MPIPALGPNGLLPVGVHDCSLEEIRAAFGHFARSTRRLDLTAKLEAYVSEARQSQLILWIGIDGSYVTDKPEPEDIDIVVALAPGHDFRTSVLPFEYNLISRRRVKVGYQFDALVAPEASEALDRHMAFFQKSRDGMPKGILRVRP